ncbi:MAG: lamin tail domain-containing protein [Fibrobacteres bacterium]|nr:lamin tail domain-containing protein [Fibrobacterota bacterium]
MIKCICILMAIFMFQCSREDKIDINSTSIGESEVNILLSIRSPSGTAKAKLLQTEYDRLVISVSGSGMDTLYDTFALGMNEAYKQVTVSDITPGSGRKIRAWTENDSAGKMIHFPDDTVLTLKAGLTHNVTLHLEPCAGSLHFTFTDIGTDVDTVFCSFASATDTFAAFSKVSRGGASVSLDYIPDGLNGKLSVYGTYFSGSSRDTIYRYTQIITFDAGADSVIVATFVKSASAAKIDVIAIRPGMTVIQGSMNTKTMAESGPVYITEVLTASNFEYVEIYNPGYDSVVYDSLYIYYNKINRLLRNVHIPANGFFVAGDSSLPGVDTVVTLNLLSAGNEPISLKNGNKETIDFVFLPIVKNEYVAMELIPPGGVLFNNINMNWVPSTGVIEGFMTIKGTPGK